MHKEEVKGKGVNNGNEWQVSHYPSIVKGKCRISVQIVLCIF